MAGTNPTSGNREDRPKGGREKRERRDGEFQKEKSPYNERVVFINRVAKALRLSNNVKNVVICKDEADCDKRIVEIYEQSKG